MENSGQRQSMLSNISNGAYSVAGNISNTTSKAVDNIQQSFDNTMKKIDIIPSVNSTSEFLQSNSIIAKFAFLIMAIFIFIVALKLIIRIISYFILTKSGTIKLVDGLIDGNEAYTFPQDPNSNSNAKTIPKSNNATTGVEFTWSVWLYVNSITSGPNDTTYKHVFSKGNNNWNTSSSNPSGVAYPNNAPGVYLSPTTNDLYIFMNTYDIINEQVVVNGIPLNKWFNLTICCVNKSLDIYINGIIVNSHQLVSVPKQNYGDVFVCNNGGFSGNLSELVYYNKAISIKTIQQNVASGPNLNYISKNRTAKNGSDYLSMEWYFQNPLFGLNR
jgi:hypothetical protein